MNARVRLFVPLYLAVAVLSVTAPVVSGQGRPSDASGDLGRDLALARETFSADRAFATVAEVAPGWRLPGNSAFDTAIDHVAAVLRDAGYSEEADAPLSLRIEKHPMSRPSWEPLSGELVVVGETKPLLRFPENRHMIAIGSFPTPAEGIQADVVFVGGMRAADFAGLDVEGKIVFGAAPVAGLFREAVQKRGAVGVLAYDIPAFNRPDENLDAISFSAIPYDAERSSFGILLSTRAWRYLAARAAEGPLRVRVALATRLEAAPERAIVAEVRGATHPDERFVLTAHLQEPGANDNASGVGVLAEIARALAANVRSGRVRPNRTLTMLFGDEITISDRFARADSARTIRWGMSLDMVGEDTERTGGTFLVERMPDPGAVWSRGLDVHTEWFSGDPLPLRDVRPHFLNDLVLDRCRAAGAATGWEVRSNPFEGGSDHQSFLDRGIPAVLLWHFTDQFYHTDLDTIDKVSTESLQRVGECVMATSLLLAAPTLDAPLYVVRETLGAALIRLEAEARLSTKAIADGESRNAQATILRSWSEWYTGALHSIRELALDPGDPELEQAIAEAVDAVEAHLVRLIGRL